jgi:hypothetical protein
MHSEVRGSHLCRTSGCRDEFSWLPTDPTGKIRIPHWQVGMPAKHVSAVSFQIFRYAHHSQSSSSHFTSCYSIPADRSSGLVISETVLIYNKKSRIRCQLLPIIIKGTIKLRSYNLSPEDRTQPTRSTSYTPNIPQTINSIYQYNRYN